jgi:hypothetical protein
MSEATSNTTLPLRLPPFDFTGHPDAALLRLCASLSKMRDAQDQLGDAIARTKFAIVRTPAVTVDGRRVKGLAI